MKRRYIWYNAIRIGSLLLLFTLLVFSYYPVITLGTLKGVNIDLELLYVAIVVAVSCHLPLLWRHRRDLYRVWPLRLLAVFLLYSTLTSLWSLNPTRAFVTVAFFWLLFLLVCTVLVERTWLKHHQSLLIRLGAATISLSCLFALWQIIAETFGVSSRYTLLPAHYQSFIFGVARPTGFALEPQFFGSLLLAPFGYGAWRLLANKASRYEILGFVAIATMLILTISRGAVIAAGVTFLLVAAIVSKPKIWRGLALLVISGIVAASIQFGAGELNTHSRINGFQTVQASFSQLTFGVFDAPPARAATRVSQRQLGYVESSTTSRLTMADASLRLWSHSPQTALFGVGIGGYGAALHAHYPQGFSVGTIANDYYLEMLAETGLIGLGLFLFFVGALLLRLLQTHQHIFATLLVGYLTQWWFFSGNANVVHVWVLVGVSLAFSTLSAKKSPRSE